MARKSRVGLAEVTMTLAARLPWWGGVALAVISYVLLHAVAQRTPPTAPGTAGIAPFVLAAIGQTLAGIGQYLIPVLCLVGAGVSAVRRHKAGRLHRVAASGAPAVAAMSWAEFEILVQEYFRREGFSTELQGGGGPDGGVDVQLSKGTDTYLVQCKHWRAWRVGVQPVRELYGLMAAGRLAGGYMVTSGEFTQAARDFAKGRELHLIDGSALRRGIANQVAAKTQAPVLRAVQNLSPAVSVAATAAANDPGGVSAEVPSCPLCQAPMVKRRARQASGEAQAFWGCSQYAHTRCRGTRALE